ncbi:hypothetical protein EXIGLDRAFT_840967 [Exidia glandulosa HHB12029]|uniref:Uncharacterized protein n=1 Tax=Exidia glandulosa HHB12029 TaxID=1314781 RepID=A0A165E699_EXIGL|nr:hypothetical protein EXIGLDRAFT_840967 [Exidia glandulosa HHB12029]
MYSYEVYDIDLESGHVTPHESQSQSQSQYEETQPEGSQDWVASQISNIGVSFSCSSVTDEVVLHHIKETYKGAYNTDWWINNDKDVDVDVDDDAVTVQLDSATQAVAVYSQESSVSETPGPQLFPSGLTADEQEDANSQAVHVPGDVSYDGGSQTSTSTQTTSYPNSDTTSATYDGSFSGRQMHSHYTDSQTTSTFVDSSQSTGRGYDADGEATTSDSDMTYSPSSTILFGSQSQSQGSGLDTSTPGVDIYDPLTFDISPAGTPYHDDGIDPSSQGSEAPVDKDGNVYILAAGWITAEEFQAGFHRNGRVRTPLVRSPSPEITPLVRLPSPE